MNKKTKIVKWEDPPDPMNYSRWVEVADELRGNPNRWACIAEYDNILTGRTNAASLRDGTLGRSALTRNAGFEIVSRKVGDVIRLYGKFIGSTED